MNLLSFVLILFSAALIGCLPGDGLEAQTPNSTVNDGLDADDGSGGTVDPADPDPVTGPVTPVDPADPGIPMDPGTPGGPVVGGPQPGDIVADSTPDPRVEYPPKGDPLPAEPPVVEPNTDPYPPIIALIEVPPAIITTDSAAFEVWVADNTRGRGIDHNECKLDDGAWEICENTFSFEDVADGMHTVVARTKDRDRNLSTEVSYSFLVDTEAPVIQWLATVDVLVSATVADFEFSASDYTSGVDGYQCSLDGAAFAACQSPSQLTGLSNGEHTYSARASDKAGLISNVINHTWTVDTNIPTVTITKTPAALTNETGASFSFTGTAPSSPIDRFECDVDGGGYKTCNSPEAYTGLVDGSHKFLVKAYTVVGNVSLPVSFDWVIDTVAPTVNISKMPSDPTAESVSQFDFMGQDDRSGVAGYVCNINQVGYQSCNSPRMYTGHIDGTQTFSVQAIDRAGNVSQPANYSWLVDLTAPTVTITKKPENPNNSSDGVVEFVGNDTGAGIASYECQIDGKGYKACSSGETFQGLAEGTHAVDVRAIDKVGLTSAPAQAWWMIDQTGPEIVFQKQPADMIYIGDEGDVLFTVQDGSGVDSYECRLNTVIVSCTEGINLAILADAVEDLTFEVSAKDVLGNTSSAAVNWKTDYNFEDSKTNLSVSEDRPVDVLFVVDNSGSMDDERANLAERIDGFISKVDGLDWQISVISTSVDRQLNGDGNFVELEGRPGEHILHAGMDISEAQTVFGNTVQNFGNGSGDEMGIWATKRAIDRYIDGEQSHVDFFRDGADLSVVILSDEDENSEGKDIKISPDNMVEFVRNTWNGEKNFTFHSMITMPGDQVCKDTQSYSFFGNVYAELSRATGFGQVGGALIGSVCDADYTAQLADIGQSVKDRQNTIELACAPADVDGDGNPDLEMSYKGPQDTSYSVFNGTNQVIGKKLVFDDLLLPGDYQVEHKCLVN